ncbi:hypothetical protein Hypma_007070 [Hypsizygus marmoreus]|uniref:Uncharacterized protein n=1 Tax=Hypsizygus marmoreus TaxID=39966 RepID=A0A369KHC4_HYPMA|nr:hypothetical protein Hypma_007070 [Hypsizygus marmoreus]
MEGTSEDPTPLTLCPLNPSVLHVVNGSQNGISSHTFHGRDWFNEGDAVIFDCVIVDVLEPRPYEGSPSVWR